MKKKQEKDIEQLFRRHYEKMYNLARCILSDDDESKDVVSEVFATILADEVVLLPGSEEGYLMRSVRNRCLNLIAHKSVKESIRKLIFRLRYLQEKSYQEVADEVGVSKVTVFNHLSKAMDWIKTTLKQQVKQ